MRKIMIGLTPMLLAMSSAAVAAEPAWKVSEVSGDVRLVDSGRARAAVRGALLASGSTIATGANARAVIVRGEEFVVISPRTQLRVPAASSPNKIMQLIEDFGTAVFKINKKSTPHFGVQTPYLAAVVKGTTFTVSVGPEGGSVQVTEGAVEVSTLDGGAAELVRPGAIAQVGASDLYRLSIDGEDSKVVRSPRAPASEDGNGSAKGAARSNYSGPKSDVVRIVNPIAEQARSFADDTNGLVEGGSMAEFAHAEFRDQNRGQSKDKDGGNGNGDGGDKDKDDKGKDDKDKDTDKGDDGKGDDGKGDDGKSDGDKGDGGNGDGDKGDGGNGDDGNGDDGKGDGDKGDGDKGDDGKGDDGKGDGGKDDGGRGDDGDDGDDDDRDNDDDGDNDDDDGDDDD